MPELEPKTRDVENRSTWWRRRRNYFILALLAIWTSQWALKQLGWLFEWTAKPEDGRLGQIFDTFVILAAGLVLMVYALRQISRHDDERKANLDRFNDMAVKAKTAKHTHA